MSGFIGYLVFEELALTFAYSEHLCSARGTYTLSRRLTVLHGDAFGIFHFLLGTAFHTIRLNHIDLPFITNNRTFPGLMSRVSSCKLYKTAGQSLPKYSQDYYEDNGDTGSD